MDDVRYLPLSTLDELLNWHAPTNIAEKKLFETIVDLDCDQDLIAGTPGQRVIVCHGEVTCN
jgi:hypothetical protein